MSKSRFLVFIILISFSHLCFATKCLKDVRANVQAQANFIVTPELVKGKVNAFLYEKNLNDFKRGRALAENSEVVERQMALFNKRFQYCTSNPRLVVMLYLKLELKKIVVGLSV